MRRALPAGMYDADAIEAINFEQLVTATDRLLLRAGRAVRRRPSVPSLAAGSARELCGPHRRLESRGSFARTALRAVHPACEPTSIVRAGRDDRAARSSVLAVAVAIPALAALALTLAAVL